MCQHRPFWLLNCSEGHILDSPNLVHVKSGRAWITSGQRVTRSQNCKAVAPPPIGCTHAGGEFLQAQLLPLTCSGRRYSLYLKMDKCSYWILCERKIYIQWQWAFLQIYVNCVKFERENRKGKGGEEGRKTEYFFKTESVDCYFEIFFYYMFVLFFRIQEILIFLFSFSKMKYSGSNSP